MKPVLMGRMLRTTVILAALAGLGGCSMFSSDDPRYEPTPLTEYAAGISANMLWSVNLGSGSGYGFIPTLLGDSVYAAAPSGSVARIDLASGRVIWQSSVDMRLSAGAGSDGTTTAVAAPDGTVIAFDEQGKERWRARATSEVAVPPLVGGGVVVVRSTDYRIQAFDAANGELLWNVQRPGPALALKTSMQMVYAEGLVIAGLPNGKLMALDAHTGGVQWEGTVAAPQGATDLERISDVVGAPRILGPLLCAAAYQGRIVCFDVSQGGIPIWQRAFSSTTGIAIDSSQLYGSDAHGAVHAFSLADGHEVWKQEGLRNRRLTAPAVSPQAVALADFEGYVHFLSRSDGSLLGRLQIGGGQVLSAPVATDRGVLVQNGNGTLVYLGLN